MSTIIRALRLVGVMLILAVPCSSGTPEIQPGSDTSYKGGLPLASSTSSKNKAEEIVRTVSSRTTVEPSEVEQALPFIEDYCECGGTEQAVQKVLLAAVEMGCRQECFYETAKCMRDGVESGLTADRTETAVMSSLTDAQAWCKEQGLAMSGADAGEHLRVSFRGHLSAAMHPLP